MCSLLLKDLISDFYWCGFGSHFVHLTFFLLLFLNMLFSILMTLYSNLFKGMLLWTCFTFDGPISDSAMLIGKLGIFFFSKGIPIERTAKTDSDWKDGQAEPSLHWAHRSFCWFYHVAAHILSSFFTFGKQSQWNLSFVYTSYVSVPVRTAVKFGKRTVSFQFYNLKYDT